MPFALLLLNSREFTHRVKSVSMAKFTSQEVEALQNGGNQVNDVFLFWSLESPDTCADYAQLFSACKGNIFEGLGFWKAATS